MTKISVPNQLLGPQLIAIPGADMLELAHRDVHVDEILLIPTSMWSEFMDGELAFRLPLYLARHFFALCQMEKLTWQATGEPVLATDTLLHYPDKVYFIYNPVNKGISWFWKRPLEVYANLEGLLISASVEQQQKQIELWSAVPRYGVYPCIPAGDTAKKGRPSRELLLSTDGLYDFKYGLSGLFLTPETYRPVFSYFNHIGLKWRATGKVVCKNDTPAGNPPHIVVWCKEETVVWQYVLPSNELDRGIYPVYVLQDDPWCKNIDDRPDICMVDYTLNMCSPPPARNSLY